VPDDMGLWETMQQYQRWAVTTAGDAEIDAIRGDKLARKYFRKHGLIAPPVRAGPGLAKIAAAATGVAGSKKGRIGIRGLTRVDPFPIYCRDVERQCNPKRISLETLAGR